MSMVLKTKKIGVKKVAGSKGKIAYKGLLVLVAGPSGVGKGTVIQRLKEIFPKFVYPISCTTREMRPGEKDGQVYHFITKRKFLNGIKKGDFLEYACVHEVNYYGTPKKPIVDGLKKGKVVVREVDVQGFHAIRKAIPKRNLLTVFLHAKSRRALIQRILKRSKLSREELKRRMESADREMKDMYLFDYKVWSRENEVEKCVADVVALIKKGAEKMGIKLAS